MGPDGVFGTYRRQLQRRQRAEVVDDQDPFIPPLVPGTVGTLWCSTPETCMAVSWPAGAGPVVIVTHNGGQTWSTVAAQGLPTAKFFTGLACPTASDCWVSGNTPFNVAPDTQLSPGNGGVVLSSANGGQTWQSTALPKGITTIDTISCPNSRKCFALASKWALIRSSLPQGHTPQRLQPPAVLRSFALLVYLASGH